MMTRIRNYQWAISLGIMILIIFAPMLVMNLYVHHNNDFDLHIMFAESFKNGKGMPSFTLAHPAWQILVLGLSYIPFFSLREAAFVTQIAGYLILAALLIRLQVQTIGKTGGISTIFFVISLMLVTPIFLFVFSNGKYYLGYIGITTYHNPTINLLKPVALLNFLMATDILGKSTDIVKKSLVAGFATAISLLIKPNLIICLLPALGLLVILFLLREKQINWQLLIIGFILPSMIILAWQYLLTYGEGGNVIFAPFAVMRLYSNHLLLNFIFSIWFPFWVAIAYLKEAKNDLRMVFAWLIFGFGAVFTYLLAESGERFSDGNFIWCGEIALFILFVVSALFFLKRFVAKKCRGTLEWIILLFGFTPHLVAGLIYYIYCLTNNNFI